MVPLCAWQDVVSAVGLVGGDKVGVVDGGAGDEILQVGDELSL